MLRCHIDLRSVAAARRSSCLRHLVKRGKPIAGVASILQHTVTDEASAACAAEAVGEPGLGVCVPVEVDAWTHGEAAITAAMRHALPPPLAELPLAVESSAAVEAAAAAADHLSSTGAAAVVFTVQEGTEPSLLRSCLQQVRARPFGVRIAAGADPALLVAARDEGATDFVSCLAGKAAPRPSAVLQALGVRPPDANFGTLFLAEHVPDAA
mmetsp:Transcript_22398/g.73097  ORF Transcript_22398/g.73097 Transcript_22398/m.73097 type:complete len:211 (+) Transcript_22398:185-817(+)